MAFDYGTDDVVEGGGDFKNPEVGDHTARLRSIIHLGMCREEFRNNGKIEIKKPAPEVVFIFELKDEEDFEDDGDTPLSISKAFPLKKGDKATATKFIKTLDPSEKMSGFDDFIGLPCQVNCKGSKDTGDNGLPKYVNFGGLSGLPAKFAKMVDPISVEGVGHVRFEDLTKEAILELNPYQHVYKLMMKGDNYKGSKAEAIIAEIRKDNPDYAKYDDKKPDNSTPENNPDAKPEKKCDMDDKEEF